LIGASNIEVANIGDTRARISEAEKAGVKPFPALTPNGNTLYTLTWVHHYRM